LQCHPGATGKKQKAGADGHADRDFPAGSRVLLALVAILHRYSHGRIFI
jgi:hypothetical protein